MEITSLSGLGDTQVEILIRRLHIWVWIYRSGARAEMQTLDHPWVDGVGATGSRRKKKEKEEVEEKGEEGDKGEEEEGEKEGGPARLSYRDGRVP